MQGCLCPPCKRDVGDKQKCSMFYCRQHFPLLILHHKNSWNFDEIVSEACQTLN